MTLSSASYHHVTSYERQKLGGHRLDWQNQPISIAHHGLSLLREGDLSARMVKAVQAKSTRTPALSFFLSAIFFRSARKYRERSYRYHLLDTAHVVENLILALRSLALPFILCHNFDDGRVNHLLGLDETKEVSLAVLQVLELGPRLSEEERIRDIPELPEDIRKASQVAEREIHYPTIREMHTAGATVIDQAWLANAAVHFLFMTNLETLDRLWGARGYRYAMMTAGRLEERLYLTATAMDLGCCGIGAFYDEEATKLLGLNRASRLLYLVAVGPVKTLRVCEH